jgi:hydrogenase expression/formation protein HypE
MTTRIEPPIVFSCPSSIPAIDRVLLGHGSGGKLSAQLVERVFLPAFGNPTLNQLNDQATFSINGVRLAMTTDSFVVKPLFFPGGDIGSLAVHGTINDLAMGGAQPLYLSVAFILEEGLEMESLGKIADSIHRAAHAAGVQVITGDTKVVEQGKGDGLFINTTGIGLVPNALQLGSERARPGDKIILSGSIGDHGIAILAKREGLEFETTIESDTAPLHKLVDAMLGTGAAIRCMRDPTRGGLSSSLNEIASRSQVGMVIEEEQIPVREEVRGACEMLGLDPLYVANEGKMIAIVESAAAERIVDVMRGNTYGSEARVIGTVVEQHPGTVVMKTTFGTTRIVDMLAGDQLPRIC